MIKTRSSKEIPAVALFQEYLKINNDWMLEWIKQKGAAKSGKIVTAKSKGYYVVGLMGKNYLAHRVIWALSHGQHPSSSQEIDHIDGDPSNNNISNLRLCTRSENTRNRVGNKNSTSKYKGVHFDSKRQKWFASGQDKNGVYKYIARFDNEVDAAIAYNKFAIENHGSFAKLNKIEAD